MSLRNTPYTPKRIVEKNIMFRIPVYQRLFVWGAEQIDKLLRDLLESYKNSEIHNNAPLRKYYIGEITVRNQDDGWVVVDGQQRLTFLTLLFAVCESKLQTRQGWVDFIHPKDCGDDLRIKYVGRTNDREGIRELERACPFEKPSSVNDYFSQFRACFSAFLEQNGGVSFAEKFANFVYEKTAFLTVELPQDYSPRDLNWYFEKLNSTGRQITPIDEIRGLLQLKDDQLAQWNACMDFSSKYEVPNTADQDAPETLVPQTYLDLLNSDEEPSGDADESDGKSRRHFERSILTPEVFLLHVWNLENDKERGDVEKEDCVEGDPDTIIQLFKGKWNNNANADLIEEMIAYRKWLDHNIICSEGDDGRGRYTFRTGSYFDDIEESKRKDMLVLQSFLFVSSGEKQEWVLKAYRQFCKSPEQNQILTTESLEEADDRRHALLNMKGNIDINQFTYQAHNRYWFFKLDYILWKKRDESRYFDPCKVKEFKVAIDSFEFRSNRSVEHLHPQNPANDKDRWDAESLDSFGNLALITPGTNSVLSNASVDEKFARIRGRLAQGYGLESLKLLKMGLSADFKESNWNVDKAKTHCEEMMELLKRHYGIEDPDRRLRQ